MSNIGSNIRRIRELIPERIKIVAVSKTMTAADIKAAYDAGQRIFGENRVNELISKINLLPSDIEWHFVGHLQTNKVRQLIPHVKLIHSVDSFRLLESIDRESAKNRLVTECLLQFHIAREETKYGFDLEESLSMLASAGFKELGNVRIRGVMGMATFTADMAAVREEFRYLRSCFGILRERYFSSDPYFSEISMGMSGDYETAIEEGATMIRLGTVIFGDRKKKQ